MVSAIEVDPVASNTPILALEALRDVYMTRQRSLNAVQGALKGTTVALTKSGRALSDYVESGPLSDLDRIINTRNTFTALRLRDEAIDPLILELRRETKPLASTLSAIKDALTALRADPIDAIRLDRAVKGLQSVAMRDHAIAALLPSLEETLRTAQITLGTMFGQALHTALADQGVQMGGRAPHFEAGPFAIDVDFAGRAASISYGKEIVVKRVPLSIDAVMQACLRARTAIMGRSVDGPTWMTQFHDAWRTAQNSASRGGRANIVSCYFHFVLLRQSKAFRSAPSKATITDYTRAQFAYDFYDVAQRQRQSIENLHASAHDAMKAQTDNPEKSMWIIEGDSPHSGRYIGDITFE